MLPAYCLLPLLLHNSEIRAVTFVCCGLKQKGTFKGLSTWYQIPNDFNTGKSSFHLHIFLCICSHDTETTFRYRTNCSGMSYSSFHSEWNSRSGAKFHSGIMSTQHELRSALKIANRVAISGASGAWSGAKTTRENVYMSLSILPCECRTNFTLEQNLFRNESHSGIICINSPLQKLQV